MNFNWYVLSTAMMLTTLYIYFIGDPIINFYIFGREKKYYDIIKYFGILLFIITLFVIATKFFLSKINLNESLLLPIVLTLIITNTASWVSRANANYSTNYWYGTKGILETIIFSIRPGLFFLKSVLPITLYPTFGFLVLFKLIAMTIWLQSQPPYKP